MLPKINIEFFGFLKDKPKRNPAGVVALILQGETNGVATYKPNDDLSKLSGDELLYVTQAFAGGPREVIVASSTGEYTDALNLLKNKRFNYLAIPDIDEVETELIVDWIIQKRDEDRKRFKAVLPHTEANHESIVNFTTEDIVVGNETYSASEYTARIAGILAGLPFTHSATYQVLEEVDSINEIDNPDGAVSDGELILINDGEKIKIGRGVNSLVDIKPEDRKNDEFKSIRVMDVLDMIHDEIYDNFNNHYIGKVPNTYDNQVLFINEVNRGFSELEGLELLSDIEDNRAWVDVDTQRAAWENAGIDTTDWDDDEVKEKPFRRNVYLAGKIRVVETIEDLDFSIEI